MKEQRNDMVIITGATNGIGKAITQRVLASGQVCYAVVRDVAKMREMFSNVDLSNLFVTDYHCKSFHENMPLYYKTDASHAVLVLNAFDISPIKMAVELTTEDISKNIDFNIAKQIETVLKAWEFARYQNVSLKIVSIDSGAAYRPICGWSMYCAGKAYINMFLKVFSKENEIPIVLYDPGVVDTNMQETIRSSDIHDFPLVETFKNYHSLHQLNSPADVAEDIWERYLSKWTAKEFCERFCDME